MRHRLYDRLRQLERLREIARQAAAQRDDHAQLDSLIEGFQAFVDHSGIEQGPEESLQSALARALEITERELWEQIDAGINPMYKWLSEHGVLEELKKREAAGTVAGG